MASWPSMVLGVATGASEAEPFWKAFLRSLANRGLRGVKLVVADDHKGLRAAAAKVFSATHQRCRVPSAICRLPSPRARIDSLAVDGSGTPSPMCRPSSGRPRWRCSRPSSPIDGSAIDPVPQGRRPRGRRGDSAETAHGQWRQVADALRERFPRLADLMDAARDDVLAYMAFPREHWPQIASTNPLERLNGEIKRRADVIG